MVDFIVSAPAGYQVLARDQDGETHWYPVMALDCVVDGYVRPVIPGKVVNGDYVMLLDDGRVFDSGNGAIYPNHEDWAEARSETVEVPEMARKDYPAFKEMGLTGRAVGALRNNGIHDLGDLPKFTAAEVRGIRNVSSEAVGALDHFLKRHDLSFRGDPDAPHEPEVVAKAQSKAVAEAKKTRKSASVL